MPAAVAMICISAMLITKLSISVAAVAALNASMSATTPFPFTVGYMEVHVADDVPDAWMFVTAWKLLSAAGVSRVDLFPYARDNEGPWMQAFVIVEGTRLVQDTYDLWRAGIDLSGQANLFAGQLECFASRLTP